MKFRHLGGRPTASRKKHAEEIMKADIKNIIRGGGRRPTGRRNGTARYRPSERCKRVWGSDARQLTEAADAADMQGPSEFDHHVRQMHRFDDGTDASRFANTCVLDLFTPVSKNRDKMPFLWRAADKIMALGRFLGHGLAKRMWQNIQITGLYNLYHYDHQTYESCWGNQPPPTRELALLAEEEYKRVFLISEKHPLVMMKKPRRRPRYHR